MHENKPTSRIATALEAILARDLNTLRTGLIHGVDAPQIDLTAFMEAAIELLEQQLEVDRIFVCDMRDGTIIAGWQKGKNIVRLQDWESRYHPLEDDATLQRALEGDELVVGPVDGEGVDLAFSLPLDDGRVWLVALDDTRSARTFSELDMAWIALVRDLAVIKSRLSMTST